MYAVLRPRINGKGADNSLCLANPEIHMTLMARAHCCTFQFHLKFEKVYILDSGFVFDNCVSYFNQTEISNEIIATYSLRNA